MEQNAAFEDLLGNFGYGGRSRGGFIAAVRRAAARGDANNLSLSGSAKRTWDSMVEYAEKYHPTLLEWDSTTTTTGDSEAALFQRLQRGLDEVPKVYDEDILEQAAEIAGLYRDQGLQVDYNDDIDAVPFSLIADKRGWWERMRYQARTFRAAGYLQQYRARLNAKRTIHEAPTA